MRAGDTIIVDASIRYARAAGYGAAIAPPAGRSLIITRVYTQSVIARGDNLDYGRPASITVPFERIISLNGAAFIQDEPGSGPRRLGAKPEDTDEQTYIGQDHPGIQWLWEDLATYAKGKSWCNEFDVLCARVGIPGRPRPFSVVRLLNGVSFTSTVDARSQREAEEKIDAALASRS